MDGFSRDEEYLRDPTCDVDRDECNGCARHPMGHDGGGQ